MRKSAVLYTGVLLLLALPFSAAAQHSSGVIINEFLASNTSGLADPQFAEYSDWIELYNIGTDQIDITGWYLTDDPAVPAKWPVKSTIIKPGGFRGFWADGRDFDWHTNFSLAKSGGFLGLYDSDTTVVDSVTYPEQRTDISYGRAPDDPFSWFYLTDPTPADHNSNNHYLGFTAPPGINLESGFYDAAVTAGIIPSDPDAVIYYSLDGSHPDENSTLYTDIITIDSTSVLKAVAIKPDHINSAVICNTYFINESTKLPVFSLTTDPRNFFDDRIGIYVEGTNGIAGLCSDTPKNWNQDWERPVHIEFYDENRNLVIKQDAGIKISGGCSRIYPQKSLAIWARNEYGKENFNYKFFEDRDVEEYKSLVLRTSAQDWWRTMFRDGMIHTLLKGCMDIDYQDYKPSVVFLNGEYFGIHNIREKLNEHYIETIFNVDRDNIDLIEISKEVRVKEGDEIAYEHLYNFISDNDMSLPENFEYVKTLMDVDEFIDYVIAEIYVANGDWPGNNIKAWRRKSPAGRFRWMIFDLDFGFGGNSRGWYSYNNLAQATDPNGSDWPNPPWSTLMLRKMLTNDSFKNEFIQRFAYHVNTTFKPDRVLNIIQNLQNKIAAEIPRHKNRWEKSISFTPTWDEGVEIMREFTRKRPEYVKKHFSDKFNLGGTATLTLKVKDGIGGYITAFNRILTDTIFAGEFFKKAPLTLEAKAKPGFRFKGWSGISAAEANKAELILNYNYTVTAEFIPDSGFADTPVINEINYNSSPQFDAEDWVEIYNPTEFDFDLSGWIFRDSVYSHEFQIKPNTVLQPDSYLVLCRDTSTFKVFYPEVTNYAGNFDFGLSNGGEYIRLYDNFGLLVDSVYYSDEYPWPVEADGTGSTLSLKYADLDNSLPESWFASIPYGTPGISNDIVNSVVVNAQEIPSVFELSQNYPNPFNPATTIKYSIPLNSLRNSAGSQQNRESRIENPSSSFHHQASGIRNQVSVSLKVYDILGREVAVLVNDNQPPGNYSVKFDGTDLSSGIYIYVLTSGNLQDHKKMIILK